jgi:Zn-dependent protease with chaperone function
MRYLEMALGFASVGFVVANAAISLLTILIWRATRRRRLRADSLFVMRMLPAIGSATFLFGVILPAFFFFEPRATTERAGPALLVFVVAAAALFAFGLRRVIASWLHTQRFERVWRAAGLESAYPGVPVRSYRVSSALPLAALVGVFRPRLFVSGSFLDALSADERQAVLNHEAGHLRSRDNLKRALMKLAPDWLAMSSAGREIEAAWAMAAEEDADDRAAGRDRAHALDLGSALLKASRLAALPSGVASSFCDGAPIATRVERLLSDPPVRRRPLMTRSARWACALATLVAGAFLAAPALQAAYAITESVVHLLR